MKRIAEETRHGVVLYPPTAARPYYRLDYRDTSGQRHQLSGGRDHDEAWARACLLEERLALSVSATSAAKPFRALVAELLAEVGPGWSPRHLADTTDHLAAMVDTIGDIACWDLTRADVRDVIAAGGAPSTVRHRRAALGRALSWGYDNEWLPHPRSRYIAKTARTAAASAGRTHGEVALFIDPDAIPSADDARALADAMFEAGGPKGGEQAWLMVAVAASTGLRQGELFALRVGDLDVPAGQVRVDRQFVYVNGAPVQETAPKWGRRRRTVLPVSAVWGAPLRDRLAAFVAGRPPSALVFTAPRGGALHPSNFGRRQLRPARAAAPGWRADWTWHSLRHTFCSHLLSEGPGRRAANVADVSVAAGHRDPSTTMSMYVGATRGTTDRLNDLMA